MGRPKGGTIKPEPRDVRGICVSPDCGRDQMVATKCDDGTRLYSPYCSRCKELRKQRRGKVAPGLSRKERLRAQIGDNRCWRCRWDEAACDMHRVVPGAEGGRYRIGNTVLLCPNCHRLAHRGKVTREELSALICPADE